MRAMLSLKNVTRFGIWRFCRVPLLLFAFSMATSGWCQDLAPRAYIITPVHSNAVTLKHAFFSGDLLLDGALPIADATARASVSVFSYAHSFRIQGRSASFAGSLPYGVGNCRGAVAGAETNAY